MSESIALDDTAALTVIAENTWAYGMDRGFTSHAIAENVASAVARAVCPPDCVVVRRDDLREVLENYASLLAYKDASDEESMRLAQEVDRLRAIVKGERK